jgi:hypothetical protein
MIIDRFPMGSKVIFLDIDGVLNRTRAATHIRLDEDLMLLLKERKLSTFALKSGVDWDGPSNLWSFLYIFQIRKTRKTDGIALMIFDDLFANSFNTIN